MLLKAGRAPRRLPLVARAARYRRARRGFNLVELLIALAITAALLTATLVALNASYTAYQRTTREASTHTISRLAMDRMLALIRTGVDFGPKPVDPTESIVHSNLIEIITPDGQGIMLEWDQQEQTLYVSRFDAETGDILSTHALLEGVIPQEDPNTGQIIKPFTLEFERGFRLYRATIDLVVVPDDNMSVEIEGSEARPIRLVASTMPRLAAFNPVD